MFLSPFGFVHGRACKTDQQLRLPGIAVIVFNEEHFDGWSHPERSPYLK
jgi:hypothetical protein